MCWNSSGKPPGQRLIINWRERSSLQAYVHKYGGIPSNGVMLPTCGGCGDHLHLLFQIDLSDPELGYLRLDNWNYLFILTCLNCASYEEIMYYRYYEGQEIVILQESPYICVREYSDPLDEYYVSLRSLQDDEYSLTDEDRLRLLDQKAKHQLGGMPIWLQREEHILCLVCGDEMEYIAMVDSDLHIGQNGFREKGHMFGDGGILYTFVCRECDIFAVKAQSF